MLEDSAAGQKFCPNPYPTHHMALLERAQEDSLNMTGSSKFYEILALISIQSSISQHHNETFRF
jgi:hypothetical protein